VTTHAVSDVRSDGRVARLLAAPRYEIIPVRGIEAKVEQLPVGAQVTVTASPSHGLGRTVELAERLAASGYVVVPHLAARMVSSRRELIVVVERLAAAGIDQAFVVGGDASPPAGPYSEAGDLLDELAGLDHPFTRIGVGGYPEGHPLIPDDKLLEALRRKQPHAAYVVTQLCFDADVLAAWEQTIRAEGIDLPVVVGLPGVVDRRRLAAISLQTGVGASLRYLRKNRDQLSALLRSRRYDPTTLTRAVAVRLRDKDLNAGVHLFTFNQLESTRAWAEALAAERPATWRPPGSDPTSTAAA
jgi:methylenetetrahydrofolate reductase (NADPH)